MIVRPMCLQVLVEFPVEPAVLLVRRRIASLSPRQSYDEVVGDSAPGGVVFGLDLALAHNGHESQMREDICAVVA